MQEPALVCWEELGLTAGGHVESLPECVECCLFGPPGSKGIACFQVLLGWLDAPNQERINDFRDPSTE